MSKSKIQNPIFSSYSGITIIEVILSVTVLLVGILGLLQAFPSGVATTKNLELATLAQQLAQEKIEYFLNLSYNEIAQGTIENQVRVSSDPSNRFYQFKRSSESQFVDANLNVSGNETDLKKVTVTVFWPNSLGGERSTKIVTLVTKK